MRTDKKIFKKNLRKLALENPFYPRAKKMEGLIMQKNSFEKIPDGFLKKWQEIADLIANIVNVPAALIMKTENEFMEVFTSSETENNPYKVGDTEHWYGLYCEKVIKTQKKLRIPNALKDKNWDQNPDLKLGMIAYLGFPINFPDKTPFGTLCVLDNKERKFSKENEKLLEQFKKVIELDLALIFSLRLKEKESHADIIQKLVRENEEYQAINEELKMAEQVLRESEDRLSKIMIAANDGMYDWDLKTNKVYFDPRYYQMSGYDVDEFPHNLEEFQKRVHPGDVDYVMNEAEKHLKGETNRFSVKFRFRKKSGDWQWIQGKGIIVERDEKGEPQRFVGTHRDISELKQVEETLKESEETYRNIFQNAQVGLFRTRISDGKILESNKQLSVMFGYDDLDEFIAEYKTSGNYVDEGTREKMVEMIKENGSIQNFEARFYRKDKSIFWAKYTARIFPDKDWIEGVAEDITEKKLAEEKLKSNYELLQIAGETAKFGGWSVDLEKNSCTWSDVVADIHEMPHGYAPPVEEGINFYAPEWREKITEVFTACAEKGIPYDEEMEIITSKGKRVWVRTNGRAVKDENGKIIKVQGSFQDITDQKKAEEALRQSEDKFKAISMNSPDHVLIQDLELKYTFVLNPQLGLTVEEMLGKTDYELGVPKADADNLTQIKKGVLEGKRTEQMLMPLSNLKGGIEFFEGSFSPKYDRDGKINGLIGYFRNVTDRKQAEEALNVTQHNLLVAQRIAHIGNWHWDIETNIVWWSDELYSIYGLNPGEYTPSLNSSIEKMHPDDRERVKQAVDDALKNRKPYDIDMRVIRPDGLVRMVNALGEVIFDNAGNPQSMSGTVQDITERKQAQEALQRIKWMLSKKAAAVKNEQAPLYGDLSELNTSSLILDAVGKKVLNNIADDFLRLLESSSAIYEKNGDYALGIFASGWCRFMDQASRELCNTNDNREALECGKWLCHESCWKEASLPAMESGEPVDIECQGGLHLYALPITAGDEVIGAINFGYGDPPQDKEKLSELAEKYKVPLDELVKKAREYESRPSFIIETAKDRLQASANLIGEIVSRKIAESEIIELNKELEQHVAERTAQLEASNKELEAFSYSVSHDLRAPLRHINGYVDLLNEKFREDLPEKAQHYLVTITSAAGQMGVLIDELLQFSRTGRKEVRKVKINMNALVKEVVETIKQDTEKRKISWKIQELPQVSGDYSLLKQVWINLLDNAVKYTRNTQKAEISIGYKEEEKNFVFFVRDNGVGFNMKYAHKLFGVFQRLHSVAEFEGTGIGLANVQRIIHKHNGQVWAEAETGKGARFFFSLPKSKEELS